MSHNYIYNRCLQPGEVVSSYYRLLGNGDLKGLKKLMTQRSYTMALESLGLKLSFRDPMFKEELEKIEENERSLHRVEEQLSQELKSRNFLPQIEILQSRSNGKERYIVDYTQDGKKKKLYFSKEDGSWKINYFAGRKVDAS